MVTFLSWSVGGALMSNWIAFYFGEDLTYGTLSDNNVLGIFSAQGTGYKTWADEVILSMGITDNIMYVVNNVKEDQGDLHLYFGLSCMTTCTLPRQAMRSLTSNGHLGLITIAQSEQFPVEASVVKPFFIKVPTSSPVATAAQQTIVVRPSNHDTKEVETLDRQAKLGLFFIGGIVDFDKATFESLTYALDSACLKNIYRNQRSARESMLTNFLTTAFQKARGAGALDVQSQ